MKKNCGFALILIFILCFLLCACDNSTISPWGQQSPENGQNDGENSGVTTKTYQIYVCGAVENEGYYEVKEGDTYFQAVMQAGILEQSSLPSNVYSLVNGEQTAIVVNYLENGTEKYCINANHQFFSLRLPWEGLSDEVVNKIADYIDEHGAITNKTVLREVLGDEDYENYHFKLYIAEADYEKAD